ncbi:hypothetical protein ACWDR0_28470 [Streptomyces sp. NPDC003691]
MSGAGSWPRWSLTGEPAALAKYVLPAEVAALVRLPGPPADSRLGQARDVYEALAGAGITYSYEAPSDDPDRQVVRQPAEVLWCPGHATCLDLALVLAGACLHAGLHPLVLVVDPPEPGRAAHALLAVWVDKPGPGDPDGVPVPDAEVWAGRPDGFGDLVQADLSGPSRPLLVLDPVGVARSLPSSPVLGTGAGFDDAVRAGARYALGWSWRLAVDIGRAWRERDTHTPAERPADRPMRPPYVPLDPRVHRPLQVLQAEHAVVPFQARDELTVLTDWCRGIAAGVYTGVVVVHGAGGAGKTRLALELAHRLAVEEGWYTGCLREGATGRDWLGTVVSPTLVVLDYADARTADAEQLLTVLKRRTDRGAAPAVVVMTARTIEGQWLTGLRKAWHRDGHLVHEDTPLALPPEHPAGAALFHRAARAFRHGPDGELDLEAVERAAPADWTTLDHILLALLAARAPDRLPATREDLYEEVLAHEHAYWAQAYRRNTGLGKYADAPLDVLNRAVAGLTLRAPTTRKEVTAALSAVGELAGDAQWRETVRTTLTACLQPGPGEPLALRPDPIADHLTLRELREDEDLLAAVLDGLDDERLLAALRQLNRAAAAEPGSATAMLMSWAAGGADRWRPVFAVAAEQLGAAYSAIRGLVEETSDATWLLELSGEIPFTTVSLPGLGLHADYYRLEILRADDSTEVVELAAQVHRVSLRLTATGQQEAAISAMAETVGLYRALARDNPAAHLRHLAATLNSLSDHQSAAGESQAALGSAEESTAHYRTLVRHDPITFLPGLARSLDNLADRQSATGDGQAALGTTTEAVTIRRALARDDPAAHLPDLVGSLGVLSGRQTREGDPQAALGSADEAVAHYRTLVEANPTAHLPGLATALGILSARQTAAGDRPAAVGTSAEAVAIRRVLARNDPAVHLPDLATALNDLSVRQARTGAHQAALDTVTEAVGHYRTLAQKDLAAHLPQLANSLNNLCNHRFATGDAPAALDAIVEAVGHYRALVRSNPAAHLPDLAGALNNLANMQDAIRDSPAALSTIAEAVTIRRTLAQSDPAAHLPDLAGALNTLSNQQAATGDPQAALDTITEAVTYYRALMGSNPSVHLPDLVRALDNLARRQAGNGDPRTALDTIAEAVTHYRALARSNPAAHLPGLAEALSNLSDQQAATGDRQAALGTITEAVALYRILVQTSPAAHLSGLASCLNDLNRYQSDSQARATWRSVLNELAHHPLAQAGLRACHAGFLAVDGDAERAVEELVLAALACAEGSPLPLRQARHQVRAVATTFGFQDSRLPDWAFVPLPDGLLDLTGEWARIADWPAAEDYLRRNARDRRTDFHRHLELAAALFPEDPAVNSLIAVLNEIDAQGLDGFLDRGRLLHETRRLLHAWIATPDWDASKDFLDAHIATLDTPEARELLAGTESPATRQHLAVLRLGETLSHDDVFEIVTDQGTAAEHAFAALDRGDFERLELILAARPKLLTDATGAFLAAVAALARGRTDEARELAGTVAGHGTDMQRRAYAIRLRGLVLAGAADLAEVIRPDPEETP